MNRDDCGDCTAAITPADVAPVGHASSNAKGRRPVANGRLDNEKAPHAYRRRPALSFVANGERCLAAGSRLATTAVARLSSLAGDLALLCRIHRGKAPLGTTTLRCGHVTSPF